MEKSRLYIVNGLESDEPVSTESYICSFKDLLVKGVNLDDLMRSADGNLKASDLIVEYETKMLKEVKDIMY